MRKIVTVALMFALLIAVGSIFSNSSGVQALSRTGSKGAEVTQIQQKLKDQGVYSGKVDGVFGAQTFDAVKKFQQSKGITVDGVAGLQTLKALGVIVPTQQTVDVELLARAISAEARGEPYEGQVAVGAVILNRVKHPSFPNTISGVIYQPRAFTAVDDGQINMPIADSSRRAAQDALNGWDPSLGSIFYYNPKTSTSKWILSRPVVKQIGQHLFCN